MAADETVIPENTLRDTLEQAFDEHLTPTGEAVVATPAEAKPAAESVAKPDDRARGADGKFVEKPKDAPVTVAKPAVAAPAIEPAKPAFAPIKRPDSWEKGMWPIWDKLQSGQSLTSEEARKAAEYSAKRENDYREGVTTYKKEWDTAKPLIDAIAPYRQVFDQYKVDPASHVSELLRIHHSLVTGTVQEKLGIVARIIQEQRLPLDQLFIPGQDGKLYFNQQLTQFAPQRPAPQQAQQPDVRQTVQEILVQERAQQSLAAFEASPPEHYETVKATMAQILEAGLAQDLQSAYDAALRMPQHSEIFSALQEQERATKEAEKVRQAAEAAQRARRNTVSPRSATPAGKQQGDKKGLRATLEDAFDEHTASRV